MTDESSLLFVLKEDSERHERQPWPSDGIPASYLHMCSICLGSCLCVCVHSSIVYMPGTFRSFATLPVLTPHPTLPSAPIRRPTNTNTNTNGCSWTVVEKKSSLTWTELIGVDDGASREGGRWGGSEENGERKRKHKEKAWLVCRFSTCNLSYGELSCSLLFGSNRLMPRVRLNKSFMRSSGQKKKTASPLLLSVFEWFPFVREEGSSCILNSAQLVRCVSSKTRHFWKTQCIAKQF